MSYSSVGKVWDPAGFSEHVAGLDYLGWADSVTVHHTGTPNLSQRPKGWTIQHMRNLQSYYQNDLGWSAGPHLFTDEDQVFGLSPLSARGVHARSFNANSIGIEMLGNYDFEDPMSSRGAQVIQCTVRVVAALLAAMSLDPSLETIKFHRDDPLTDKTCPGGNVDKGWFVGLVRDEMGKAPAMPEAAAVDLQQVLGCVDAIAWQLAKLKSLLP